MIKILQDKYLLVSDILLAFFIIFAIAISSKVNSPNITNASSLLVSSDLWLFLEINSSHYPPLNQFMIWLTQFGKEVFWIAVAILLFAFGGIVGKKTAILVTFAIIILMPIGFAVKEIIARPRPIIPESDFLLSVDSQYAFPSGHALMVSAGATLTLVLFRGSKLKLILSLTFALEAGLVCFSRVYVGGHYPLDVLGGILLGTAVALILTRFERKLDPLLLMYISSLKDTWMKRNRTPLSNNNNNIR